MHALRKINKRTRKYLACLLLRGVCPAWNGGVIIKNSRRFLNFFILLSFFLPLLPSFRKWSLEDSSQTPLIPSRWLRTPPKAMVRAASPSWWWPKAQVSEMLGVLWTDVTAQNVGVFLRLHWSFVLRRRCELFWDFHVFRQIMRAPVSLLGRLFEH